MLPSPDNPAGMSVPGAPPPGARKTSLSLRLPRFLFASVLVPVITAFLLNSFADPDLWGHTRYGLDTLRNGALTTVDPYSFTSDQAWTNHEWLAEVLTAIAYRSGGGPGLFVLKLAALALAVLFLDLTIRRSWLSPVARWSLLAVAAIGFAPQAIALRPQVFSILCFSALLAVLYRLPRQRIPRAALTAFVFAVWANLHGGFLVGLGFLWLYLGVRTLSRKENALSAALLATVATASTLLNPYGLGLWVFLRNTVGLGRADIQDWQPLFSDLRQLVPWLSVVAVVVLAVRRGRLSATVRLIPALALAALTIPISRVQCFFALATVAEAAPWLATLGNEALLLKKPPSRTEVFAASGVALAILCGAMAVVRPSTTCLPPEPRWQPIHWAPEPEAILFLKENNLEGRLLTWFDYGQYALWHLYPKMLVSYDGRRETVYSERVRQEHLLFYFDPAAVSYADRIGADYAWLPNRIPARDALELHGWHVIFSGPISSVLSRHSEGRFSQPAPYVGSRCFPGP